MSIRAGNKKTFHDKTRYVKDRLDHRGIYRISPEWTKWAKRYLSKAERRRKSDKERKWSDDMSEYPKDKNGKQFQPGDLFAEGFIGKMIWNGKASIFSPPVGLFTGEQVEYPIKDGWLVKNYWEGAFLEGDQCHSLFVNRWDGEFIGDWDETLIIGNICDVNRIIDKLCQI